MKSIAMKRIFVVISVVLLIAVVFMSMPTLIDAQMEIMAIAAAIIHIAFWSVFIVIFRKERMMMKYSAVFWGVSLFSSAFAVTAMLTQIASGLASIFAVIFSAPLEAILILLSSEYYDSKLALIVGIVIALGVPVAFLVWSIHNYKNKASEEKKDEENC